MELFIGALAFRKSHDRQPRLTIDNSAYLPLHVAPTRLAETALKKSSKLGRPESVLTHPMID